jgi:pimeloyl-ACP methyl ester carboxylesterase
VEPIIGVDGKAPATYGREKENSKMPKRSRSRTEILKFQQARIEVERLGKGPPLLLLHGEDGYELNLDLIEKLSVRFEVFVPRMPGFGKSTLPDSVRNVDDIAYLWLDLLDHYKLKNVTVVGTSVGAWLALEIATKNSDRLKKLVLAGAVGVKFGGAYDRDIADVYFHSADRVRAMRFFDPAKDPQADMTGYTKAQALAVARQREAIVKLCWEPYMHNPALRQRLNRVTLPTLVLWGAKDGMTPPKYGRALARNLPDSSFVSIARAGHFPHIEQPELFGQALDNFLSA